jgi:hypothetical protein
LVASKFTEEHRAAFDWLNEHTTNEISFFGLEVEAWRIGDSLPAPKFNIISQPNDWSKAVRQQAAALGDHEILEHKRLQFEFWSAFKPWLEERSQMKTQKPAYRHWLNVSLGRSGFHLAAIASLWNTETESYSIPEIRTELYIRSPDAKEQLELLRSRNTELINSIGTELTFHMAEGSRSAKIYVRRNFDFREPSKWEEAVWLAGEAAAAFFGYVSAVDQRSLSDGRFFQTTDESFFLNFRKTKGKVPLRALKVVEPPQRV